MKFEKLQEKPTVEAVQDEVIGFWKKNEIFEESVRTRGIKGTINFYDGPPFPTGIPHHGTVLVSFIKDMVSRYQTMQGYSVPRTWGWDCHGLPIENQAEKQLGINDKSIIEKELGIDKFNDKCREIVSTNNDNWKTYVEEMCRWVDYDNAYKTMTPEFMESVMWAFKECYDKGLIYRGYRVTPYCMHCETSLSISDTRESDSTRPRQDRWIIVKFKTNQEVNGKPVYFIAWTTTPWTLPSNLCLAVGEKLNYAFVDMGEEIYVACKNTIGNYKNIFGEEPVIVKEAMGTELVGIEYEPLFPYFEEKRAEGAFKVIPADYVSDEDGVGIVHIAPCFGEDDYWACQNNGVTAAVNPVDEKGRYTAEVTDFYEESKEKNVIEMNGPVIRFLYDNGKAVADGTLVHNYPHCWRCKNPLIYKAMEAWYFDIGKIKDRLIELNEEVNWIPETVKHGRFGNWLEGARDWNISRNRYWSTPIPIWECDNESCDNRVVLGSVDEIEKASGIRLTDLHRQFMDKVTFKCDCCGGTMVRVPEVLDCWFESGSVPYASKHYPFENKEWFENNSPSDFVVEYTGQIRCWFYYLHVLSVALFDKPAFKNCVVHGTILAKDGKKLSKSSKNYTDPMELMRKHGTDAYRLYMYQSNAMLIGDLLFDENGIQDANQKILLPFWNACKFFINYANIDDLDFDINAPLNTDNQLDQWILAKLYDATNGIKQAMDSYQVNRYVEYIEPLIDGLTNWYIRRSRRRFWEVGVSDDKRNAYQTLYYVLVTTAKLLAPVAPVMAEKVYKTLTTGRSVHLEDWPTIPAEYKNDELLEKIDIVQSVISLARSIRAKNKVKNRQPLSTLNVAFPDAGKNEIVREFMDIIAEELNVKEVVVLDSVDEVATVKLDPNFNEIRAKYPQQIPVIIKAVKSKQFELTDSEAILTIDGEKQSFDPSIILVSYIAKEGMHVASEKGIVVSLDMTITPELREECVARDIVRSIQDSRKKMDCDITDRIKISIDGELKPQWIEFICNETLSDVTELTDCFETVSVETDGATINVKISK